LSALKKSMSIIATAIGTRARRATVHMRSNSSSKVRRLAMPVSPSIRESRSYRSRSLCTPRLRIARKGEEHRLPRHCELERQLELPGNDVVGGEVVEDVSDSRQEERGKDTRRPPARPRARSARKPSTISATKSTSNAAWSSG